MRWLRILSSLAAGVLIAGVAPAGAVEPKPVAAEIWKRIEPFFSPPAEFGEDYGAYRSPLVFDDGTPVRTPEDWQRRRAEILDYWHAMMGPWPPLIVNPEVEILETTRRENFAQHRIRFRWTPNEKTEGYLLIPEGELEIENEELRKGSAEGKSRIRDEGLKEGNSAVPEGEGKRPAVLVVFYEPETAVGLGKPNRDYALQLARRGFVTLSIGTSEATKAKTYALYHPSLEAAEVEPLSMLAYAAANAWFVLASRPEVDAERIGIVGHSFGGKWAMFAACLWDRFACAAWSDPGIVFDESRPAVNYWEPWYLGYHPPPWRKRGMITAENPARGLYPRLRAEGRDLHELRALMAPRPFLVSGGSEDPPERWRALNHTVAVNRLLGYEHRVGMTNRAGHEPTREANEVVCLFFEYFLKYGGMEGKS